MPSLQFDKQRWFSQAEDLKMVLNTSLNNSVPIAQKVGYEFDGWGVFSSGGHVDEKAVVVYDSDGTSWKAIDRVVTVYEDEDEWIAEYIPESDIPIVIETVKVFDSQGKAVKSDRFWTDDYPNGLYKYPKDVVLYPLYKKASFINDYYNEKNERCHIYTMIDGVLTKVEIIKDT